MKRIKTSDRLPNKNGEYFCIGNEYSEQGKCVKLFIVDDNWTIIYWKNNIEYWYDNLDEQYKDVQFNINDTIKLDWLEHELINPKFMDSFLDFPGSLREYINKFI